MSIVGVRYDKKCLVTLVNAVLNCNTATPPMVFAIWGYELPSGLLHCYSVAVVEVALRISEKIYRLVVIH